MQRSRPSSLSLMHTRLSLKIQFNRCSGTCGSSWPLDLVQIVTLFVCRKFTHSMSLSTSKGHPGQKRRSTHLNVCSEFQKDFCGPPMHSFGASPQVQTVLRSNNDHITTCSLVFFLHSGQAITYTSVSPCPCSLPVHTHAFLGVSVCTC